MKSVASRSSAAKSSKQLFAGRNPLGETIYINDIPYVVIGVMRNKEQDSCYDGWDVNKVFVPFSVMQRRFPNKPPATALSVDRLLVQPKSSSSTKPAKARSAPHSARLTTSIPPTRKPQASGTLSKKRRPSPR